MSAGTISIPQAARLLAVTPARVRQLIAEGYIERTDRGRVLLVSAVQGYLRSWHASQTRAEDRHADGTRVRNARADEIELRVAAERERLMERADADASMQIVVDITKAELASLPRRIGGTTADRRRAKELVEAVGRTIDISLARQTENLRTGREF